MIGRHRQTAILAISVVSVLTLGGGASADDTRVDVKWSGEYRARAEGYFNYDMTDGKHDRTNPVLQRVRLGATVGLTEDLQAYFQVQDTRAFGDESSTASNEANVDLHQGFVRLHTGDNMDLTVGRQEWSFGDQRMIGALDWSNTGRAFDGVRAQTTFARGNLNLFWGRLQRVFPEDRNEKGRDLYGAYSHFDVGEKSAIEPYLLLYRASDSTPSEIEGQRDSSSVLAYGVRLNGKWGAASATAELVGQTGEIAGDDLTAYALGLMASYRMGGAEGWFEPQVGLDRASGDEDPTDGERNEFFNFFPTNHMHYGELDLLGWRNLVSPWIGCAFGGQGHTVRVRLSGFWLDEEMGRWSSAGGTTLGFDPTGVSGSEIGREIDIVYSTKIYERVSVRAGYGLFSPGEFAEATRGPDATQFAYVEGGVKF